MNAAARPYRNTQLPQNPGNCGWAALLPPRKGRPPLEGDTRADITIIGAGFAGLAAAWRLHQGDSALKITLLEAEQVGDGPAGRNSGFIIDLPHDVAGGDFGAEAESEARDHITLQRRAVDFARAQAAAHGWGEDILDARSGRYNLAITPAGARSVSGYARLLERLGEAHTVLGPQAVCDVTGSDAYRSGLHLPGTVMIQPAAYIRALADALPAAVALHERSPALALVPHGTGWRVETPSGAVSCGRVILANNGYAERFGFFSRRLMHVFTYASLSEPFAPDRLGGLRNWAATPPTPMGTTLRRISGADGDRLLVRARYTYNPSLRVGARAMGRVAALHRRKLARRFPALTGLRLPHVWGGAMALTLNHVPAFGEVAPGVFAASGCNGLGASNATASGLALAEMLLGTDSDLVRIHRAFSAPRRLPPAAAMLPGARAVLAWQEWRAGVE